MRPRADRSGPPSPAVLSILFALGEEVRHGYGIMKEVEERTAGRVSLLPSSLYATIKRMLGEGLIEEVTDPDASTGPGRPRRFYRITSVGSELASREADRMTALLDMARANRAVVGPATVPDGGP